MEDALYGIMIQTKSQLKVVGENETIRYLGHEIDMTFDMVKLVQNKLNGIRS